MRRATAKATEFVLYRFLIAVLRRSFRKTPMWSAARNAAKAEYFIPSKSGTQMRRVHFKCAECQKFFKDGDIAVDHVDPVIAPERGFEGYDILIERLYNGPLQILCNYSGVRDGERSCHHKKTKREREILKETNKRLLAAGKSIKTIDR